MMNDLEVYHNILLINRPWLDTTTSDQKYEQLYHELSKENLAQQPLYELAFIKPLTAKRKYYYALFDNEANRFINNIHQLVNQALNEEAKKYWIHSALSKKLKDKLRQTEEVIKSNQFYLSALDDKKQTDNVYIIQCLKYQLIRLYLEIQNSFLQHLKEDVLTEQNIHSIYFSEEVLQQSYIKEAPDYNLPKAANIITEQLPKKTFNAIKADIRNETNNGVLKYEEIIAKKDRFALAEEKMFEEGIINEQYDFVKKKGNNEKIAALFRIMMQKNYFNDYSFINGKKKIVDLQVRHFFNHRYRSNIDREIRNFRDQKGLDQYLDNNLRIRLLIPS